MATNKLSAIQKEALAKVGTGRTAIVCFETAFALVGHGFITSDFPSADCVALVASHLTEEGRKVAGELAKAAEERRSKRNKAARERSDAYRLLGLKRTAYGWE